MPLLQRPISPQDLLDTSPVVDLNLVCMDGTVSTHQAVFAWSSAFLRRLLSAKFVMEDGGKRKEEVALLLPEFPARVVDTLAQFLETGQVNVNVAADDTFRDDFAAVWEALKIDVISPEKVYVSNKSSSVIVNTEGLLQEGNLPNSKVGNGIIYPAASTPFLEKLPDQLVNLDNSLCEIVPIGELDDKSIIEILDTENIAINNTINNSIDSTVNTSIDTTINSSIDTNINNTVTSFEIPEDPYSFKEARTRSSKNKRKSLEEAPVPRPAKQKPPKKMPVIDPSPPNKPVEQQTPAPLPPLVARGPESDVEPIPCYVCHATRDKEKRVLNMKNVFYLKNHISKCLYASGRLFSVVKPGKDNTGQDGGPMDEFGLKNGYWYRCETEGCWLQQKKGVHGQVCYKVYAIHMASQHGLVEQVMRQDGEPQALVLLERILEYEARTQAGGPPGQTKPLVRAPPPPLLSRDIWDVKSGAPELEEAVDDPEPVVNNPFTVTTAVGRKPVPAPVKPKTPVVSDTVDFKILGGQAALHNCFLCQGVGRNNKDGLNLSFTDISTLKEHYSRCLYNERQMFSFVPPGPRNTGEDGGPQDELGETQRGKYKCQVKGCWLQKKTGERGKVGYKVFAIHMASQHGVLEQMMEVDPRPVVQELLQGLKVYDKEGRHGIARCRFEQCKNIQFKADSKRELKLHYSSMHFRKYFNIESETGLPPGFTKTGTRAICENCSAAANKPVYIQGEKEAVMGHLVVKHDVLLDILREAAASVQEAREVIQDVYPEQLTEIYMETLDKKGQALPFSEDFMAKMAF